MDNELSLSRFLDEKCDEIINFMNKPNKRGLPNGIVQYKSGYLAKYNHQQLGIYPTVELAYEAYSNEKENIYMKILF